MENIRTIVIVGVGLLIAGTGTLAVLYRRKKRAPLLQRIIRQYLQSGDFNGLALVDLRNDFKELPSLVKEVETLIRERKVDALYHDQQLNAHIKRLQEESPEVQLKKLESHGEFAVLYPSQETLKVATDESAYAGKPFTLRMALGEPQLTFQAFDLSVLEFYRNDPRYRYDHDDIAGKIGVTSEYYESQDMLEHDRILLQSFGFCFDQERNRSVAVFLRDLSGLSPQHQQIWHAKQLQGEFKLHPDYYRAMIVGEWYEGVSVFDAFLEELHQINELCKAIWGGPLFRHEYHENEKPRGFGFLIRPTLKEFNEFVQTMDKMLSDNINVAFFGTEVELTREVDRGVGKIELQGKGTIQLLEEWLGKKFRSSQDELIAEAIATLRKIRKLRQKPAHAINEDSFDKRFLGEQRELILEGFYAVSTLRQAFALHPRASGYAVPEWLDSGTIWLE